MPGLGKLVILLGFGICLPLAKAEQPKSPFVATFDRFAMYDEIEKSQAGRLLLTELSCTACHATTDSHLEPKRGPRLIGAGNRLQPEWIKRFLASPQATKPGTTMPLMFAGWPDAEKTQAIDALSVFLGSQREDFPEIKASGLIAVPFEFWAKGQPQVGKRLYHQIGCVACHEADPTHETAQIKPSATDELLDLLDPQELAELGLAAKARKVAAVPLGDLAAKYDRKSLTFFLLDPKKTRPSGRMPSLKLTATEAADIAANLLREQAPATEITMQDSSKALIETGQKLFVEVGCANCHDAQGTKPRTVGKPLDQVSDNASGRSCLGKASRGLPSFSMNTEQVNAITSVLMEEKLSTPLAAKDRLQFSLLQLNCYACHERDDQGGVGRYQRAYFETVGNVDIGDEGRLPPPLTGVGAKLQPAWLAQVLKGTGDVRLHMRIRMPQFPANAVKQLPALFAEVDHPPGKPQSEAVVFGTLEGLAEPGRVLLDHGCVECHLFRGEALPGVVGVDLEGITNRVHPRWFHDFLLNPGNLKPRTRMPTFFPRGASQNKAVLQGDTERQIAAMWAYLTVLDKQPLPEKIETIRSRDFELKPQDRPIVLRTFMKAAGTHAIAVGFPEGVHFAFDAEQSRLAAVWRGRFLDAQGTWFSRFTPPAEPLGDILPWLDGLPFAILKDEVKSWPMGDPFNPAYRYLGYRLDKQGVPTFLYRYERFDIEDRIEPLDNTQIQRQLKITNRKPTETAPPLWFRGISGKTVKREKVYTCSNDLGLTTTASESLGHLGKIRKTESGMEWIAPLDIQEEKTIEVKYQW